MSNVNSKPAFKKMYLIDPKHISSPSPNNNSFPLISSSGDQMRPETLALQDRVSKLDKEMELILSDRNLSDEDKLRQYLETLRKHIMSVKHLNQALQQPIPVRIITENNIHNNGNMTEWEEEEEVIPQQKTQIIKQKPTKRKLTKKSIGKLRVNSDPFQTPQQEVFGVQSQRKRSNTSVDDLLSFDSTNRSSKEKKSSLQKMLSKPIVSSVVSPYGETKNYSINQIMKEIPKDHPNYDDVKDILNNMKRYSFHQKDVGWDPQNGELLYEGRPLRDTNIIAAMKYRYGIGEDNSDSEDISQGLHLFQKILDSGPDIHDENKINSFFPSKAVQSGNGRWLRY